MGPVVAQLYLEDYSRLVRDVACRPVGPLFEGYTVIEGVTQLYRTLTRDSPARRAFGAGHVRGAACRVPRARRPLGQE